MNNIQYTHWQQKQICYKNEVKSSVLYTKLSFSHVVVFIIPSPDWGRVCFLSFHAYTVCLRRRSEDSFSEDSYKTVRAFLFQAAGSCPRAHPGISSRMSACPALRPCLELCPGEGAEITTAAQVKDARPFAQRQRVGGEVRLHLPVEGGLSWGNLWNCDGLKTWNERTGN